MPVQKRLRLLKLFGALWLVCAMLGGVIGLLLRGPLTGVFVGSLVAIAYWAVSMAGAEHFVLDLYGAKLLDAVQAPRLYEMVRELSKQAKIEPPIIYTVGHRVPNAFALIRGERNPVIVVSNGLTEKLEREEVRAIMALMVARIAGGMVGAWAVAATLAGVPLSSVPLTGSDDLADNPKERDPAVEVKGIKRVFLNGVMALCGAMLRMAWTPQDVTETDAAAASLLTKPEFLSSALRKIDKELPKTWWEASGFNPATALLFAVPPLPPLELISDASPLWLRALRQFPYRHPSVTERQPVTSPEPVSTGS